MDPLTVRKLFEEVEKKNNNEIDPEELAKIKKLIANMFDYKGSPLPSSSPGASNMINNVKNEVTNMAKSALANRLGIQNTGNMKSQMLNKIASTVLKGGKAKTHKNKHKNSHKNKHKKTQKKQ